MSRYGAWRLANKSTLDAIAAPKKNKHNAKKVVIDNITFDSKHEGARYSELKLMLGAGLISDLKIHPVYPIVYKETRICDVILDFAYSKPNSVRIYEDAKGQDTDYSRLKRKLVEAFYGIKVELIR
jgi:hypothetical protein